MIVPWGVVAVSSGVPEPVDSSWVPLEHVVCSAVSSAVLSGIMGVELSGYMLPLEVETGQATDEDFLT